MAVEDSQPERRNLVITSLSIIVFYLAGGQFTDNTVNLQVVNIRFEKTEVLAGFVWLMLLWFAFRYKQRNVGHSLFAVNDSLTTFQNSRLLMYCLKKKLSLSKDTEARSKLFIDDLNFTFGSDLNICYSRIEYSDCSMDCDTGKFVVEKEYILIDSLCGFVCKPIFVFRMMIFDYDVTSRVVPYLLFLLAIFLGVYDYASPL